jgi:fermentation-respiration switch protein FrsA (DUF1100 family)
LAIVLKLLLPALIVYAAWLTLLFVGQRQLIYLSAGLPTVPGVERSHAGLRAFRIPVPGGEVDAWFLPPATASSAEARSPALIFTHGNAELIDYSVSDFAEFSRRGIGVMMVEYPGYGRSTGRPSFQTIEAAMIGAYDTLIAQPEVNRDRIIAYGRSLGGGPAAMLSTRRPIEALVLQSAFTTLRAYATRYLAPGFLVRDRFEVLEAVRAFRGPVLIVHGRGDEIVPYAHGHALATGASDGRLITHECAHNDCPPDWKAHVEQVVAFLNDKGILSQETH